MYSKATLEKHKCTADDIQPLAEKLDADKDSAFAKWISQEADRIKNGIDWNLKNWRLWWALDQAYDAPFHQISYTLLKDIIESDYDDEKVTSLVTDYGLGHLLEPALDASGNAMKNADGTAKTTLNIPVFFKVFVPLCQSYLKARWSKIYNDRNLIPFYKYEPAYSTKKNRIRCDVITQRIGQMASQFGYNNDERDSMFQALHYGISIAFPREAWYVEHRLDDNDKEVVEREGLRFNMPTPERLYYDLSERLSTINSRSGVRFAGYWHVTTLGAVKSAQYWNSDKIAFGSGTDIISNNANFFSNIYPCTLKFPTNVGMDEKNDRQAIYTAYSAADDDAAVVTTEHFCTAIPKDVGIGTYEYPVNFRMVMLNNMTPAWIEPIYCGLGAYYGYDAEGNRARNSSLTLEVMPFQDQIGNILTQWIHSAKQNLDSVIFVDTDVVPQTAINALENPGQKNLKTRHYIPYSSRDMQAKIAETRNAFESPVFPQLPTGEMQQLIRGVLDLLERALQFSPQEIGQAATHEQSATESTIIQNNVGNRVQFTGSYIDDGIWAKKKMLYESWVANGDDDAMAEVYPNYTETYDEFKKLCEEIGIEVVDRAGFNQDRVIVKAPVKSLTIDAFASSRDAANRVNNQQLAGAAVQLLTAVANNPMLAQAVGPQQLVELTNHIAAMLQMPNDFRLKPLPNAGMAGQEEQAKAVQEAMKQMAEQISKRIQEGEQGLSEAMQKGDEQVAGAISGEVGKAFQERDQAIQGLVKQVNDMGQSLEGMMAAMTGQPPQGPPQ